MTQERPSLDAGQQQFLQRVKLGDFVYVEDQDGEGEVIANRIELHGRGVRLAEPRAWLIMGEDWSGYYSRDQILTAAEYEVRQEQSALDAERREES